MRLRRLDPAPELRPLTTADAPALLTALTQSRAHLDRWLRWSGPLGSLGSVSAFLVDCEEKATQHLGAHWGFWHEHA